MGTLTEKLTLIRDELHGGSWAAMRDELIQRLNDRPYNHEIHERVKRDLERVEELMRQEVRS